MGQLDCENNETLSKSIENIFGLSIKSVNRIIGKLKRRNRNISPDQLFRGLKDNSKEFSYKSTIFFHCTRIFEGDNFDEGLLPLSSVIKDMWNKLYGLAKNKLSKAEWDEFRKKLENENYYDYCGSATQYRDKASNYCNNDGPYGFLVYQIDCFDKPISTWHYLADGPEIVYHICDSFKEIYKWNLFDRFVKNTFPVIIKFQYDMADYDMLKYAVNVLFCNTFNKELHWESNPCYSTRGMPIPKENIEKIIYL